MSTSATLNVAWPGADDDARADLRQRLEARVVLRDVALGAALPADVHVLVGGRPSAEVLDSGAALDTLVIPFAGVPAETLALLRERERLSVYNLHHNAEVVAESALALALAAAREVVPGDAALRRGDWRRRYGPDGSRTLRGGRVVLYGFGAIGRALVPMLRGLGMEVTAVRRSVAVAGREGEVRVVPPSMLGSAVGEADLVVLCAPSTEETRGVFGREMLGRFAAGAVLVNVARADLVDAAALREALVEGTLHSAALDVWWRYPRDEAERASFAPSEVELADLPNVVFSPHRSGHCHDIEGRRRAALAALLNTLARGEDAAALRVDVARGY